MLKHSLSLLSSHTCMHACACAHTHTHTLTLFLSFLKSLPATERLWKTALASSSQSFTADSWRPWLPAATLLESVGTNPAGSQDHCCQQPQDAGLLALFLPSALLVTRGRCFQKPYWPNGHTVFDLFFGGSLL